MIKSGFMADLDKRVLAFAAVLLLVVFGIIISQFGSDGLVTSKAPATTNSNVSDGLEDQINTATTFASDQSGLATEAQTSAETSSTNLNLAGNYADNLALIKSVPGTRVTYADNSPYIQTASADLPKAQLTSSKAIPNKHANNNGQFRTKCGFSHLAYDDPIVFPNQPGASHLHTFFGNTEANAYSTSDSIMDSGGSTCDGGELNRTGYWVPTMFDGQGNVRIPNYITVYYKSGGDPTEYNQLTDYPHGLQMVSGNHAATSPQDTSLVGWYCSSARDNSDVKSATIPKCGSGENLYGSIAFQRCWNGSDLWTSDLSHLAYKNDGHAKDSVSTCNPGYQMLPSLIVFLHFEEHDGNTDNWFLASDIKHDTGEKVQGGLTLHGDWWNGWNKSVNNIWNTKCNRAGISSVSNLCDGTELADPQGFKITELGAFKSSSGAKTVIPASDVVKLCPGKAVPSNPADLAYCKH